MRVVSRAAPIRPASATQAALRGAVAGLAGAILAHILTTLCGRYGSNDWLRGVSGPSFFDLALHTGLFYGVLGWATGRRRSMAIVGFNVPFFLIVMPLFVLSRYEGGSAAGSLSPLRWPLIIVSVYAVALWSTLASLGALSHPAARGRASAAAIIGSFLGYGALSIMQRLMPALLQFPRNSHSFFPPPVALLDGIFSGAGLFLGLAVARRISSRGG